MRNYINLIVKINGIYDILCALTILRIIHIPILDRLHISMITNETTPIFIRFFAYWIFTYGMIRVICNNHLVTYSYYIEAACFMNEYYNDSVNKEKTAFVIVSSLLLGLVSHPGNSSFPLRPLLFIWLLKG